MGGYHQAVDAVDAIKRQVDLVEFVGRVTPLQKAGRSFRGLCPFHTEKTPSFYVFPDRGTWRCFGSCGEGGDLFSFVQKRENVDFRGALRMLASEAGVQLSVDDARKRGQHARLAAVMSAAVDFYQRCLGEPGGAAAREYLTATRGLTAETIATWHLGWAPGEWRALRAFLANRGFDDREMVAAGLLVEGEDGREGYDRFRGRVIIPIADERGEFVAMGGRGLHGEEPKYLNSPQTALFDKSRTLFGLDHAAAAIRQAGSVVVVEGYMDVLGPWQAGTTNIVATMGTSLTGQHAQLLRRHAQRVILAMDPDAAGQSAAERAGSLVLGLETPETMARSAQAADSLAAGADIDLRVAALPPGKDPDELARHEPDAWKQVVNGAVAFPDFLLARLLGPGRPESAVEARRLVDRTVPVLTAVRDPVERAVYVQRVAARLGISEDAVLDRLRQLAPRRQAAATRRPETREPDAAPAEDFLLAILLRHPQLRHAFRSYPESLFSSALAREVFARWLRGGDHELDDEDDPVAQRIRDLRGRRLPPLSEAEARTAADGKVNEILKDRIMLHQAARAAEIAELEHQLGANRIAEIGLGAWQGSLATEDEQPIAEASMENLQLGLSIHRREIPNHR